MSTPAAAETTAGTTARTTVTDVVIVGAGVSGLVAACQLAKSGHRDVVLLEADSRVGGRVHTMRKNGDFLEIGAQWIHGKGENALWKFVGENKIALNPIANRDGEGRFLRDDGLQMPEDLVVETESKLEAIHEECNNFGSDGGGQSRETPISVGHYFRDEFERWLREKKAGRESEERLRWRRQFFDWWVKWEECDAGCDSLDDQSAVSWGDYKDYGDDASFARGYESVIETLVQSLKAQAIAVHTDRAVSNIDWSGSNGIVVTCADGSVFEAKFVVVTVSLGVLKHDHPTLFTPRLPSAKIAAIETIRFGTMDRINLDFAECFWQGDANPGFMVLWSDDRTSERPITEENWVRHVVGFDTVINQPRTLMAWVSGDAARFMETLSDAAVAGALHGLLELVTRRRVPPVVSAVVTRWHENPFHRGAYSYLSPESDRSGVGMDQLAQPVCDDFGKPRLLFAGEATDERHYGTVHGAFESGHREAKRIHTLLQDN